MSSLLNYDMNGSVPFWDWWCEELVEGEHLSVDGSFIPANASRLSRIPREQLSEAAHVKRTAREYLADLEQKNPVEATARQQDQVSTTDPDSTYSTNGDRPAEQAYFNNYPMKFVREQFFLAATAQNLK
jgi:hypothetical protein